jgi:hypothetical protein
MTAANSMDCQPASFEYTEPGDRLNRILGTGWLKSTGGWQQGRNQYSIALNQPYQQDFHTKASKKGTELIFSFWLKRTVLSIKPLARFLECLRF